MFATIQEGVEVYKQEVSGYKEWLDKLGRDRRDDFNFMRDLGNYDYHKLRAWSDKLRGMAQVLGLTKDEEKALDKEVGL